MAEQRPARCPACGASFSCGIDTGSCWCQALPVEPAALRRIAAEHHGCLCPTCLRRLAEQTPEGAPTG